MVNFRSKTRVIGPEDFKVHKPHHRCGAHPHAAPRPSCQLAQVGQPHEVYRRQVLRWTAAIRRTAAIIVTNPTRRMLPFVRLTSDDESAASLAAAVESLRRRTVGGEGKKSRNEPGARSLVAAQLLYETRRLEPIVVFLVVVHDRSLSSSLFSGLPAFQWLQFVPLSAPTLYCPLGVRLGNRNLTLLQPCPRRGKRYVERSSLDFGSLD